MKKIHERTKEASEKKGKHTTDRVNKTRKEVLFQPGDMVWVHFRKDRFPNLRKSKLMPRGAGPYKVLAKINDNAYTIDLPAEEFGVSNSFNVADLTPYLGDDLDASRSTPFQGGEDDEDIPTMAPSLPHEQPVATKKMSKDEIRIGPTTRARAKLLEQQVNSLLVDNVNYSNESFILPNSLCVCVIRYIGKEGLAQGSKKESKEAMQLGWEEASAIPRAVVPPHPSGSTA